MVRSLKFSVFLGMIEIKELRFLVVARDVMLVAMIEKHDIFMI